MLSTTCRHTLLPGLVAALIACSPALNWREVRPEATALVATFPCKPSRQSRELPLAGARVRMELLACEAAGATWAVSHAQVGDPTRVGASLAALNESLAANLGMGMAPDGVAWSVPGMTPQPQARRLQLRGQRADGTEVRVEAGVFAHGTQVFQVVVMQPAKDTAPDGEALQAFFGGLKVRV